MVMTDSDVKLVDKKKTKKNNNKKNKKKQQQQKKKKKKKKKKTNKQKGLLILESKLGDQKSMWKSFGQNHFWFLFAVTTAGVGPCGGRTSTIVQFIFYFWSFEISVNILRNQK